MENNAAKSKISTYIFMDFETTGLLKEKPHILELCLLAVDRADMEEDCVFPRVINKITLCLNPEKPISHTVSNLTGLYNDSLDHQKSFTADTTMLINCFINHLNEPVCLLAHNGNEFDFPILAAELKRINESLKSSVLCADTLEAFRSLDGLPCIYSPMANMRPVNNEKRFEETTQINIYVTPSRPTMSSVPPCQKRSLPYENGNNRAKAFSLLNPHTTLYSTPQHFNACSSDRNSVSKKLKFEDKKDAIAGSSKEASTNKDNESNGAHACSRYDYNQCDETLRNRKNVATSDTKCNIHIPHSGDKSGIHVLESDVKQCDLQVLDSGTSKCDIQVLDSNDKKCEILANDSFNEKWKDSEYLTVSETNVVNGTEEIPTTSMNSDCLVSDIANGSGYYIRKPSGASEINIRNKKATNDHYQLSEPISSTNVALPLQVSKCNDPLASPPAVLTNMVVRVPTTTQTVPPSKQLSYKLKKIYKRIFGLQPLATHRAEDDCVMLVKIAKKTPGFIKWVDDNAILLTHSASTVRQGR